MPASFSSSSPRRMKKRAREGEERAHSEPRNLAGGSREPEEEEEEEGEEGEGEGEEGRETCRRQFRQTSIERKRGRRRKGHAGFLLLLCRKIKRSVHVVQAIKFCVASTCDTGVCASYVFTKKKKEKNLLRQHQPMLFQELSCLFRKAIMYIVRSTFQRERGSLLPPSCHSLLYYADIGSQ